MIIKVDNEINLQTVNLLDVENRYDVIMKNKEFLKKWLGWLDFYKNINDLIEYTKICQEKERKKEAYVFGIYYKNTYVGCIEIQDIDYRNKRCEIGYWLAENANKKGIMIKSCKKVIEYIFNEIKLNKINILVATENFSSQAIPEKMKFTKEGMLEDNECLYGKFVDNYIYGITRKKWSERGKA